MSSIRYSGIIPPMVTPLRGRDELDAPGLERLVEHILKGGVSGLYILGTTGEGTSLSHRLRRQLVDCVCRLVNGRVPVLVGITDTIFVESVALARHAADAGASAVVLAPPYYFPEGQPELREYLDHLLPELPLPVFLYNMPALTKVYFEPETVQWALENPRVIGFKDGSGNFEYLHRIIRLAKRRPDWQVFIGPEEKLAEGLKAGAHGGISAGANVFPRLYVGLHAACLAGDKERVNHAHAQILRISESLYNIGRHPSSVIKGIKCALSVLGICDDFMAEPFHRFRSEERVKVERQVAELLRVIQ
jgi:dihydrodipicolinate synthase/N-acetylneuraminate lyase